MQLRFITGLGLALVLSGCGGHQEASPNPPTQPPAVPPPAQSRPATFLYAASNPNDKIAAYTVDKTTGAVSSIPGSTLSTGPGPTIVAVDPKSRFVFVANSCGTTCAGSVSAYTINASTGILTAVDGSPFPTGLGSGWVTVHPSGRFLYVANFLGGNISGFTIGAGGALSPIAGSPFPAGSRPGGIALHPSGRFAYVADCGMVCQSQTSGTGTVIGY